MDIYTKIAQIVQSRLNGAHITVYKDVRNKEQIGYGIAIRREDESTAPVIYIDHMIKEGYDPECIAYYVIDTYITCNPDTRFIKTSCDFGDYERTKKYLTLRLLNKKWNTTSLKNIPHKDFLDMAVVVKIIRERYAGKREDSVVITHELLKKWEKSFEEVYAQAALNYFTREKTVVMNLLDFVLPSSPTIRTELSDESPYYILTNEKRCYGATNILDEKILYHFARSRDVDLIVVPLSIHAMLLTPFKRSTFAKRIINSINRNEIPSEEWLSDHFYIYRKDTGWDENY